jgi:hypothetical protein
MNILEFNLRYTCSLKLLPHHLDELNFFLWLPDHCPSISRVSKGCWGSIIVPLPLSVYSIGAFVSPRYFRWQPLNVVFLGGVSS